MCPMPDDHEKEPIGDDDSIELEAQQSEAAEDDSSMNLEIFEVKGENYVALEDEALAERLMAHLDEQADKLADNED